MDSLITEDERNYFLDPLFRTFGVPLWNYSLIDGSENANVVTIPLATQDSVRALLQFFTLNESAWFALASRHCADSIVDLSFSLDDLNEWFNPISKLWIYDGFLADTAYAPYLSWINSAKEEAPLLFRGCETLWIEWWGYYVNQSGTPVAATAGAYALTLCDGGGGGGSGSGPDGPTSAWWNIPEVNSTPGGGVSPTSNVSILQRILDEIGSLVDDPDCVRNFALEVQQEIVRLLETGIIDPCSPNESSEEIIAEALNRICADQRDGEGLGENIDSFEFNPGGPYLNPAFYDLSEFYESLSTNDYIIEDGSFLNCQYAQCIYGLILSNTESNGCALVEPLFDSENFGVRLHLTTGPVDFTTYNDELDIAEIFLVVDCTGENMTDLSLAATMIHELIHAEIIMTLFNMGLDPNNMNSFSQAWDSYQINYMTELKNVYDLNDIHHAVMLFANSSVERIATILWELNGMLLTKEHYYHMAWEGLRYLDDQWVDDQFGLSSSYYTLHQELLASDPGLSIGC